MDIETEFIEAHQFPFPELGDPLTATPFTIEFTPPVTNLQLFFEDVFDGSDPFYTPGVCRPVAPECDEYSVGAVVAPLPAESADESLEYDSHHPSNKFVWFDVTPERMDVYVRDTVDPGRVKTFCETLAAEYGVELQKVTGLPAIPRGESTV